MSDIPRFWRRRMALSYALLPFSWVFALGVRLRRWLYACGVFAVYRAPCLVMVVGNVSVGGNGKTPLVMALVRALRARGVAVGVVSRGYGGENRAVVEVCLDSEVGVVGDEALLMKRGCGVPVFVGRRRALAVAELLARYPEVQLVVCDDGLQHYALARDVEWVAMARDLGVGNGFLLPAGALREGVGRLALVDGVCVHGVGAVGVKMPAGVPVYELVERCVGMRFLNAQEYLPLADFMGVRLQALTAIARPERFLARLQALGLSVGAFRFLPDHAMLPESVADFAPDGYIVVTEKDAVKLSGWSVNLQARVVVLAYELLLPDEAVDAVFLKISKEKR